MGTVADQLAVVSRIEAYLRSLDPEGHIGLDGHSNMISLMDLWTQVLNKKTKSDSVGSLTATEGATSSPVHDWYARGASYWEDESVPADIDGVLGGQSHVADMDIKESHIFLQQLIEKYGVGQGRCLDCGAGVGRVSQHLLTHFFKEVDLLEQSPKMIKQARTIMSTTPTTASDIPSGEALSCSAVTCTYCSSKLRTRGEAREFYCMGIQDFFEGSVADTTPQSTVSSSTETAAGGSEGVIDQSYDCIWFQWVIGCVTDADLVAFLRQAGGRLRDGGIIIIKDNFVRKGWSFEYDAEDHSIARSRQYFDAVLQLANMDIVAEAQQVEWDTELMPVSMLALARRASPAERFLRNMSNKS